jgi:hypothetical protein
MSKESRAWWRRSTGDLVDEARAAYKNGRLVIMFRRCLQVLWLDPENATARRGVATFFVREGKYPLALLYDPDHPAIPARIPRPKYGADWVRQSVARYIGAPPGDFVTLAQRRQRSCAIPATTPRRHRLFHLPTLIEDEGLRWLDDVEQARGQAVRIPSKT